MSWVWQRTGDPLGDFLRLIYLLEEALERLGASPDGTLGEKLNAPPVQDFLDSVPDGSSLRQGLRNLVRMRNQVIHERIPVPEEVFKQGPHLVARLLQGLEMQGFYKPKELRVRLEALRATPPPPQAMPHPIRPEEVQAPKRPQGPPSLPIPRRSLALRRLALPRR